MRDTRSPKAIALSIGIILGVMVLVILVARSFLTVKPAADNASITLKRDGREITVSIDGSVFENGVLVDTWDAEKTRAFFDYYNSQYASYEGGEITLVFSGAGGTSSSSVPAGDELTEIIFNGGGGGGGGNGGGDTGGIFESGTPTPTPLPYGSSPPLPSTSPSWCKHWLLSYCADAPEPSSTPTPNPTTGPTPLPPDCNNVGNQQTGRTVISNDLCIPTPTP